MREIIRHFTIAILLLMGSAQAASAAILSNFNSNPEGWSVVSFANLSTNNYGIMGSYGVTWKPAGGNPGGYIDTGDPDGGDFTFSAPAAFLGNKSSATGLTYDLIHPAGGAIDYQTTDVMLTGNGLRLLWHRSPDITPGSNWMTINLSFSPSSNWHIGTTTNATAVTVADFQSVLANVSGLFIRGEYTNGLETAGIDNVQLNEASAVPEPASLAIWGGIGLAGMVACRRQTRRQAVKA